MKYVFAFLMFSVFGCASQVSNSAKSSIEFEEVNHYPYELIPEKYQIIDTQQKMDAVFSVIHQKSGGTRLAPIPTVTSEETYIIFKPILKNTNDVTIKEIFSENDTLYINLQDFDNPQVEKSTRTSPNILIKLLKKVSTKKIVLNY